MINDKDKLIQETVRDLQEMKSRQTKQAQPF